MFPSSNEYGIPDLELQQIRIPTRTAMVVADSGEGTMVQYHTLSPRPGSVINFYVQDRRFESLWERPVDSLQRLMAHSFSALVEPDFSMYTEHPFALALFNLYRSRWLSRFWQLSGVKVIPSLSWNAQTLPLVGLGIPKGAVVCCESRPRFKDRGVLLEGIQEAIRQISPEAILFYGAKETDLPNLPSGPTYVFLESWSPRRRSRNAAIQEALSEISIGNRSSATQV